MRIKPGVDLYGLEPMMVLAALVVDQVYQDHHAVCVVTSAGDGKHMVNSLHYRGRGLDFRTTAEGLTPEQVQAIVADIRKRLNSQFDVVVEHDHIHLEFQPKNQPKL